MFPIALIICAHATAAPTELAYRILERQPQTTDNFVQGLEIFQKKLYLSSGGYGESVLRRYNLKTGELELEHSINPDLFAEGLTIFRNQLYLLCWRAKRAMIFDPTNLSLLSNFKIPGEGWGITHNETHLIYSDGTHRLRFINPTSHKIDRTLSVLEGGRKVQNLNELEYIHNRIWANIWLSNKIIVIDPMSGKVISFIDLTDLAKEINTNASSDVLNGIALDTDKKYIWLTGKRWPWRFKIELSEAMPPTPKTR
jgi:glutaminyl-peptide cyclotransferase